MHLILIGAVVCAQVPDASSPAEILSFVELMSRANLSRLEHGAFEFEILHGKSADIESAAAGRLEDPVRARGTYRFSGKNLLYERRFADSNLRRGVSRDPRGRTHAPYVTVQAVTDGRSTCSATRSVTDAKTMEVHTSAELSKDETQGDFNTAFDFTSSVGLNVDSFKLSADIRHFRNGLSRLKRLGYDKNDPNVINVHFETNGILRAYTIDGKRGCSPVRVADLDRNGTLVSEIRYSDFEHLEGCCWVPMTKVLFTRGGQAKVISVTSFSAGPLTPADFTLTFDEPVMVADLPRGLDYAGVRSICLSRLPRRDAGASPLLLRPGVSPDAADRPRMPGEP